MDAVGKAIDEDDLRKFGIDRFIRIPLTRIDSTFRRISLDESLLGTTENSQSNEIAKPECSNKSGKTVSMSKSSSSTSINRSIIIPLTRIDSTIRRISIDDSSSEISETKENEKDFDKNVSKFESSNRSGRTVSTSSSCSSTRLTVASDTELSNSDDSSSSHITPSLKTKRKNFDRPLKRKRVASMKENDKVKRSKDSSDLSAKSQTKVGKSAVMHLSRSESSSSQSENDSVKASAKQPETQVSSDPSLIPCHSSDESSKSSAVESYFSASDNSSVSSTKSDEVVICNFVKEKTATKSGKESSDDCMEVINVADEAEEKKTRDVLLSMYCGYCLLHFFNLTQLNAHIKGCSFRSKTGYNQFFYRFCRVCKTWFGSRTRFFSHLQDDHHFETTKAYIEALTSLTEPKSSDTQFEKFKNISLSALSPHRKMYNYCEACDSKLMQSSDLLNHVQLAEHRKNQMESNEVEVDSILKKKTLFTFRLKCNACDFEELSFLSFSTHVQSDGHRMAPKSGDNYKLDCVLCDKSFSTFGRLKEHVNSLIHRQMISCKQNLYTRAEFPWGRPPIACLRCKSNFSRFPQLYKHLKRHHNGPQSYPMIHVNKPTAPSVSFECNKCSSKFATPSGLHFHHNKHHKTTDEEDKGHLGKIVRIRVKKNDFGQWVQCDLCSTFLFTMEMRRKHRDDVHSKINQPFLRDPNQKTETPKAAQPSKYKIAPSLQLMIQRKLATQPKPFTKNKATEDGKSEDEVEEISCQKCWQTFWYRTELTAHLKVCSKTHIFSFPSRTIHAPQGATLISGDKAEVLRCQTCFQRFSNKKDLSSHLETCQIKTTGTHDVRARPSSETADRKKTESSNKLDFLKEFVKSFEKEKESEETGTIKVTLADTPERTLPPTTSMDLSKTDKPNLNQEETSNTDFTRRISGLTEDGSNLKSHFLSGISATAKTQTISQKVQNGSQCNTVASAKSQPVQYRLTSPQTYIHHPIKTGFSVKPSLSKTFQTLPDKPVSILPVQPVSVTSSNPVVQQQSVILSQRQTALASIPPIRLVSVTSRNPVVQQQSVIQSQPLTTVTSGPPISLVSVVHQANTTQSRSTFSSKSLIKNVADSGETNTGPAGFLNSTAIQQPAFVQNLPINNHCQNSIPLPRNNLPPTVLLNPGQFQQSIGRINPLANTSPIQPAKQLPLNSQVVQYGKRRPGLTQNYQTGNVAGQPQLQPRFQSGLSQTGLTNRNSMTATLLPGSTNQDLHLKRLQTEKILNSVLGHLNQGEFQLSSTESGAATSMTSQNEDDFVKDEEVTTSMDNDSLVIDETPLKDEQEFKNFSASGPTSQQFSSSYQYQNPGPSNQPDVDDVDNLLGEISSLVDTLAQMNESESSKENGVMSCPTCGQFFASRIELSNHNSAFHMQW